MKKFNSMLAVALAATVTFASCSKESDSTSGNGEQTKFFVKISTPANGGSRAVGGNSKDTPLTLVGGKILFSDLHGTITKVVEVVSSGATGDQVNVGTLGSGATIEQVNEDTKVVTFIGNHVADVVALPATLVGAKIDDVKKAAFSLAYIADGSGAVVSKVPVYGADETLTITGTEPNRVINADFKVNAIGSRIQISGIKGDPASVKSFKVEGIWINNYLPSMTYGVAPVASAVVDNGSEEAKYPATASAYTAPALCDVSAAGIGTKKADNEYVAGTNQFWAYNVFPNTGLGKANLPHVVIKISGLTDINDQPHNTKWLTVKGYTGATLGDIAEFQGGYSYTFGGTDGLVFEIDDVKEKPEMGEIKGLVKIEAIAWKDELVTPEF